MAILASDFSGLAGAAIAVGILTLAIAAVLTTVTVVGLLIAYKKRRVFWLMPVILPVWFVVVFCLWLLWLHR